MNEEEYIERYIKTKAVRPFTKVAGSMNGPLVGAEVGVQAGDHSALLLEHLPMGRLYLIDIWGPYTLGLSNLDFSHDYLEVLDRFAGTCAVVMRMGSEEAASEFSSGSLDFVYIDACHTYEAVRRDLRLWYPLVKPSGYLAGHDYCDTWPEVVAAVDEFAAGLRLEHLDWDWWIKKPE